MKVHGSFGHRAGAWPRWRPARGLRAVRGGMPGQPGGGMPHAPMGQEPKEEGPAEAAPEEEGRPSDLEPLGGYAEQNKKKMQIFEIDGYFRMRTDYMLQLQPRPGLHDDAADADVHHGQRRHDASPPAGCRRSRVPLDCPPPDCRRRQAARLAAPRIWARANLRLRLEPTLNVTDQVRVHAQIDVLDNTIMGSTPDSLVGINRKPQRRPAGAAPSPLYTIPRNRPRSARTATCPASAPSAPGARSTASSARCASAACPGTSGAASPSTTATAWTATVAPPSTA